jgi:hypothetical protein
MKEEINIGGYQDYINLSTDNKNTQQSSNSQNQTSENSNEDGGSDHKEVPQEVKSFETHKIEVKDELTLTLEKHNYTSKCLSEIYRILKKFCSYKLSESLCAQKPKKETNIIGKKRSLTVDDFLKKEQISQTPDELKKDEILIDNIAQILYNCKEFFNEISLSAYKYELNLTFEKNSNMIIKNLFGEDILKKDLEELILLEEEKDLDKEENFKNKIGKILKKEKESNNLKFFNMFKMKLKDLILIYVNDRVNKFENCQLKTLKDNTNYTPKEKEQIKGIIVDYINSQKESNSKNSGFELDIPQPQLNLTPLSKDEVLENNNIKNIGSIEKNENKNENIIKIKDNQEKDEQQKYSNKKTKTKTDEERGDRPENLVRVTLNRIYLFVVSEIEKIVEKKNKKLKRVSIYGDITGNSTERFKVIFEEIIINILERKTENEEVINKILNEDLSLDEITTLIDLLNMKYKDIINKFINDEFLILSNGTKIEINIFNIEKTENQKKISEKIKENMPEIKSKLKKIIECEDERLREKKGKNQV